MRTLMYLKTWLAIWLTVGLVAAVPAIGGDKGSKEEKVKLSDCPAAVQKTIRDHAGNGKIKEIEKETDKDGTVVYEAEVKKADGKEMEIEVAADGTLIKVEDEDDEDEDNDDAL